MTNCSFFRFILIYKNYHRTYLTSLLSSCFYFEFPFYISANKEAFTTHSASNLNDLVYSKGHQYIPDYTVRAITDVEFIKIRRHQYVAAQRATLMERRPKTPRGTEQLDEDAFKAEWQKANQLNQHHQEEGTPVLPPYLRSHQRNLSSGNLDELRNRPDRQKLSPLATNNMTADNGPLRTVIYPEDRSPRDSGSVTDTEKVKLLSVNSRESDKDSKYTNEGA